MIEIRDLRPDDGDALLAFFRGIPEGDRTFFKENVDDPAVLAAWVEPGAGRFIAVDGDTVVGSAAVVPLTGWSSHVGDLRVVVDPDHRGRGVGRALSQHAVLEALELGLKRLVVEVVADQESAITLFRSLGFDPEALLKDHVRDQSGAVRDLMILALSVEQSYGAMTTAGLAENV